MSEIETGSTEPIVAFVLDQLGAPLTGQADLKAKVWRTSDGEYLDWADMTFRPAGAVVSMLRTLAEVSSTASPGEYRLDFDTSAIVNPTADDTYEVTVAQDGPLLASNLPQVGEVRVGQWVDKVALRSFLVMQSYSYDPLTETITGLVWLEHGTLVYAAPTSCSVSWYNDAGVLQFTVTDAIPDTQGYFKVTQVIPLLTNCSYYTVAHVVVPGIGTVSGGKGIFTVG
jgi:hypothetical protein